MAWSAVTWGIVEARSVCSPERYFSSHSTSAATQSAKWNMMCRLGQLSILLWQALEAVVSIVDPGDESYQLQRALVEEDVAPLLSDLLHNGDSEVQAAAARAIATLAAHVRNHTQRDESDSSCRNKNNII